MKGLAGLAQLVNWDEEMTTNELRGHIEDSDCVHRVRILMESAGPSVANFDSETQLVEVFFDVTSGK